MDIVKGLPLVDESFTNSGSINKLIVVELMNEITTNDRFREKFLTFTRIVFVWVITVRAEVVKFRDKNSSSQAICNFLQTNCAQYTSKFWCTEEMPSTSFLTDAEIVTKSDYDNVGEWTISSKTALETECNATWRKEGKSVETFFSLGKH